MCARYMLFYERNKNAKAINNEKDIGSNKKKTLINY